MLMVDQKELTLCVIVLSKNLITVNYSNLIIVIVTITTCHPII